MSDPRRISVETLYKLLSSMGYQGDITAEMIDELCEHSRSLSLLFARLKELPVFTRIHRMFKHPQQIIEAFEARCDANKTDPRQFSWDGPKQTKGFHPVDREIVLVLDVTLGTLQETFEFAWSWLKEGRQESSRLEELHSGHETLSLLDGEAFKPWTITWRRIKLDAHPNSTPIGFRSAKTSPGCALLLMAAEHPDWVADLEERRIFWLSGLRCSLPKRRPWRFTPTISFSPHGEKIALHANPDHRVMRWQRVFGPTFI